MKDIQKNREALIRYLYSLPEPIRYKTSARITEGDSFCLCAKGQTLKKFFGMTIDLAGHSVIAHPKIKRTEDVDMDNLPDDLISILQIKPDEWCKMEVLYEGFSGHKQHSYSQIADWLQTLPGWPKVL